MVGSLTLHLGHRREIAKNDILLSSFFPINAMILSDATLYCSIESISWFQDFRASDDINVDITEEAEAVISSVLALSIPDIDIAPHVRSVVWSSTCRAQGQLKNKEYSTSMRLAPLCDLDHQPLGRLSQRPRPAPDSSSHRRGRGSVHARCR